MEHTILHGIKEIKSMISLVLQKAESLFQNILPFILSIFLPLLIDNEQPRQNKIEHDLILFHRFRKQPYDLGRLVIDFYVKAGKLKIDLFSTFRMRDLLNLHLAPRPGLLLVYNMMIMTKRQLCRECLQDMFYLQRYDISSKRNDISSTK